jgi:uncharacterized protein
MIAGPRDRRVRVPRTGRTGNATVLAVSALCPTCGLCCNGVLFGYVALRRSDDPSRLARLGLPLEQKGRITRFPQPCAAFDGVGCRIYAERPTYCQGFECRLLQRVQRGRFTVRAAQRSIRQARRLLATIERLLRKFAPTDARRPLNQRCGQVLTQAWDLTAPSRGLRQRARLLQATRRLVHVLASDFVT